MREVSGSDIRFQVPEGRPPVFPFFDDFDGHEGAFLIPTGRLVGTSTLTPAAAAATITRFSAPRDLTISGGAVVLDTPSVTGGSGECAIFDALGENVLGTTGAVNLGLNGPAGPIEFEFVEPVAISAGGVYYFAHSNPVGDATFVSLGFSSNLVAEIFGADPPELLSASLAAAYPLPASIAAMGSHNLSILARLDFTD